MAGDGRPTERAAGAEARRTGGIGIALAALAFVLAAGCAGRAPHPAANAPDTRADRLVAQLAVLAGDAEESARLADAAIEAADRLSAEYRMARPPLLHNVLVNVGLRDRGLCWHWTKDLLAHLRALELRSYELHWGTAYRGELLREHNSVIVTARGRAFASGVVLDGWRNAGELYWTLVSEDSYPWEPH